MRRIAFALVVAACTGEGEKTEAAAAEATAAPAPAQDPTAKAPASAEAEPVEVQIAAREPPVVTVIDAGSGKREDLALRPEAGAVEGIEIIMKTRMSMQGTAGNIPPTGVPTIAMRGTAVIERVDEHGIAFRHEVDKVEVRAEPEAPARLVESLQSSLAEFEKYRADLVIDAKGGLRGGTVFLPPSAAPPMRQTLNQITESFGQIQVPLPREPVGEGAKWRATVTIDQAGLKVEQTVDYELTALDGDELTIAATFKQKLVDDDFSAPTGVTGKVTTFESTGEGMMTLDLTHLVPTHSEITMTVKMGLEMDVMGQPQKQDMAMVIGVGFARART
jgi:hypothetical protein